MKKIIFLCFCALLASCASDEDLQEINTNEKELANMINDYELVLKGYSLDELKKEKDELTPTTQEETVAYSKRKISKIGRKEEYGFVKLKSRPSAQ